MILYFLIITIMVYKLRDLKHYITLYHIDNKYISILHKTKNIGKLYSYINNLPIEDIKINTKIGVFRDNFKKDLVRNIRFARDTYINISNEDEFININNFWKVFVALIMSEEPAYSLFRGVEIEITKCNYNVSIYYHKSNVTVDTIINSMNIYYDFNPYVISN